MPSVPAIYSPWAKGYFIQMHDLEVSFFQTNDLAMSVLQVYPLTPSPCGVLVISQ